MPMSEQLCKERKALTREAAAALIEDLDHIREVIAREHTSRSELRRLSVTLRRLLLDGDLLEISAPRIGKLELNEPDNNPIIKSNRKSPILFFQSAGVTAFGVTIRCGIVDKGGQIRSLPDFNPDCTLNVPHDGFLRQPVLCFEGNMATRSQVIDYVANHGSGAHSKTSNRTRRSKREVFDRLTRLRNAASVSVQGNRTIINMNPDAMSTSDMPFRYTADAIDPVLLELLATAQFLVTSEDVECLEAMIREELKVSQ